MNVLDNRFELIIRQSQFARSLDAILQTWLEQKLPPDFQGLLQYLDEEGPEPAEDAE